MTPAPKHPRHWGTDVRSVTRHDSSGGELFVCASEIEARECARLHNKDIDELHEALDENDRVENEAYERGKSAGFGAFCDALQKAHEAGEQVIHPDRVRAQSLINGRTPLPNPEAVPSEGEYLIRTAPVVTPSPQVVRLADDQLLAIVAAACSPTPAMIDYADGHGVGAAGNIIASDKVDMARAIIAAARNGGAK